MDIFGVCMPKKSTKKRSKKPVSTKVVNKEVEKVEKAPINHFEIPFENSSRIKEFYEKIFGWTYVDMPEMDYTMVFTSEMDKNNNPITPGAVNGGFTKRNSIQVTPTLVMTVKDIHQTIDKVKSFNGELLGDIIPVGDMGFYQLFKDPEGNVLGFFQNK